MQLKKTHKAFARQANVAGYLQFVIVMLVAQPLHNLFLFMFFLNPHPLLYIDQVVLSFVSLFWMLFFFIVSFINFYYNNNFSFLLNSFIA